MNPKIILYLIVLLIVGYVFYMSVEHFTFEEGMLIFKRLNGSLIKKFKINSYINIYNKDIQNLFKNDNVIRIWIPSNHLVNIVYKLKNGGYSRTIELQEGVYDLKNTLNNDKEIIEEIEAKILHNLPITSNSENNKILVVNKAGQILFTTDTNSRINWDLIYTDYGLDNYYVVYPWGRKLYYYYNYPYYRNYRNYRRYPRYKRHRLYHKRRN